MTEPLPTVLVVEDEPSIVDLIGAVLGPERARIVPARSGTRALAELLDLRPALITLDLVLPELDGFAVLEQVRARRDLADVPVIVISAQGDSASQRRAYQLGASDFVPKPFSVDLLDAKLAVWLRPCSLLGELQRLRDFAHEARNPLSAISAAAQVLARPDAGADPARRQRLCQAIIDESDRLARMLAARPEVAEVGRTPGCAPDALLRDILEVNLPDPAARARTRLAVPGALPPVRVGPDRLRQMLLNLIDNALAATEGGGEVTVDAFVDEDAVGLAVRDTGAGIAPEDLRRIFEDGYTTRGGARGLGLGIVRRLCQESGARLQVESAPGQGASFFLWLPRQDR